LSDTPFNYSIDVKAAKAIDVGLNVWDVSNKRYISAGRQSYVNVGQWETMVWREINPSSSAESSGMSNYYFSFYYQGSDNPFSTTYEKTGKYSSGPALVAVNLRNWTVSPANGSVFHLLQLFCPGRNKAAKLRYRTADSTAKRRGLDKSGNCDIQWRQ